VVEATCGIVVEEEIFVEVWHDVGISMQIPT